MFRRIPSLLPTLQEIARKADDVEVSSPYQFQSGDPQLILEDVRQVVLP